MAYQRCKTTPSKVQFLSKKIKKHKIEKKTKNKKTTTKKQTKTET